MTEETSPKSDLIELTADVVSAYVSNNPIPVADLPGLIGEVHATLQRVHGGTGLEEASPAPKPAVPIRKSVTPDYIVSLEDGKKFKSLKRHLSTHYGMTPDEYRAKWGLPAKPHGRAELRRRSLCARQDHGAWPKAKGTGTACAGEARAQESRCHMTT